MDSRLNPPRRLLAALLLLAVILPGVGLHAETPGHRHGSAAGRIVVEAAAVHAADATHIEASAPRWLDPCGWCARLAPSAAGLATPPGTVAAAPRCAPPIPAGASFTRQRSGAPPPGRAPPLG